VIKDDFPFFAGFQFGNTLVGFDDCDYFAIWRRSLPIALENSSIQIAIDRTGRLLRSASPRRASALALLLHRPIKAFSI
jgi:hypothetical protein